MERENEIVELGTASLETQGPIGSVEDVVAQQDLTGLTDD